MKRIIAVLLTLMMALSLTACSGDDNAKVAGTWKWNCDMTEMFQEGVNQGAGMDLATDATMEMVFVLKLNEDGKTVAAADCLVPGIGEIIGGSQREERLDLLEARIKDLGMNPEQYKYYLDLRRYGSCKHAGYGLGFERLVMYLTGVGNIRDVLPHPRTVGNADF